MFTEPTDEHRWLMSMVGEWTFEHTCDAGVGEPPMKSFGREAVRAIGDLWIQAQMTGQLPGGEGEMTAYMTLGYDVRVGRYVGNWIGSPMAHMFVYEGGRNDGGNTLTLDTTGPSFEDPNTLVRYQDVIEIKSPNERRMHSQAEDGAGGWKRFMSGVYTRV
ncbi:MAG: DUF1579 domain-containing protein [Planctomycetota bacterium]